MFNGKYLDVRIRLKLSENKCFNVSTNSFGILSYSLSGWANGTGCGTPYAISNMYMKRDLPATVHDYLTVQEVVAHLIAVIESGTYTVERIVYQIAQEKEDNNVHGY